jgi:preprotein translocase subunit SecA
MAGRGVDIKLGGAHATKEEYEDVLGLGGLFVIGTERHDARRIDNQLRGRSGRQGDAGETQFYVSMEDSLARVFASDAAKAMMSKLGVADDEPIGAKLISKSLEAAQTRIEGFNFDSRKHVLQYDDVLNTQRTAVYEMRKELLVGGTEEIAQIFDAMREGDTQFSTALDAKISELGEERLYKIARDVYLQAINTFWMEHLETMDYIRSSVKLRSYGQHDPLVEYKKEGSVHYKRMREEIVNAVKDTIEKISSEKVFEVESRALQAETDANKVIDKSGDDQPAVQTVVKKDKDNIGRNDPCHCGSGKKYKKCHGA